MPAAATTIEDLPDRLSRARLRASLATWCLNNGAPTDAATLITAAASEAITAEPQHRLGAARREIREATRALATTTCLTVGNLPSWATSNPPEPAIALLAELASTKSWDQQRILLDTYRKVIEQPEIAGAFDLLEELFPGDAGLAEIRLYLDLIEENGFDTIR